MNRQQSFARFYPTTVCARAICLLCMVAISAFAWNGPVFAQEPAFKVLAFYSTDVEPDHVHVANDALVFFRDLAARNNFVFDATTDWQRLNAVDLKPYHLIMWLNNFPQTADQRRAFEQYMEHGGGWLGLHVAGYNDETTKWPWFVDFLGGAVFYTNNWPPLPAKLRVDDNAHPVTKGLPDTLHGTGKRVVYLEAQPAAQHECPCPRDARSVELSNRNKGRHHRRRSSRRMDKYKISDDLHEHGARREDIF